MKHLLAVFSLLLSFAASAQDGKVVVLRAQFSDVHFTVTEERTSEVMKRAGDYLSDQFGQSPGFSFTPGPVVTLSCTRATYASNSSTMKDTGIGDAVREACVLSDASVKFSDYEHIALMFAGESESDGGGQDCVWPQQNSLGDLSGTITLDGKVIDKFIDFTETGKAGVVCHEFLHLYGLCDLYDTDGEWSGGLSKGLWSSTSIMDKGLKNDGGDTPPNLNAVEMEALGIGTSSKLSEGCFTLAPLGTNRTYYRYDTPEEGEYFLFECRSEEGWDRYIGGSGLLIYHMDKSAGNAWYSDWFKRNLTGFERWEYNQVNCRPDHECARIIEARPSADRVDEVFFPQTSHDSFGSETDPAWKFWNGRTSELALTDITKHTDGSVSFNVIRPIEIISQTVFQDAVILRWKTSQSLGKCSCEVSWTEKAKALSKEASGESSDFGYTIEGLDAGTSYDICIRATDESGRVFSVVTVCTTKSRIGEPRPYIWLNDAERNTDGTFKSGSRIFLKVYNASDVAKVEWMYDDAVISPDIDGKHTLDKSAELKARIFYNDGDIELITKKITVR